MDGALFSTRDDAIVGSGRRGAFQMAAAHGRPAKGYALAYTASSVAHIFMLFFKPYADHDETAFLEFLGDFRPAPFDVAHFFSNVRF